MKRVGRDGDLRREEKFATEAAAGEVHAALRTPPPRPSTFSRLLSLRDLGVRREPGRPGPQVERLRFGFYRAWDWGAPRSCARPPAHVVGGAACGARGAAGAQVQV